MNSIAIKERPILFSGAMVRALLAGIKTQTRRAVKGLEYDDDMLNGVYMFTPPKGVGSDTSFAYCKNPATSTLLLATCPYGQPGERLWVRESHAFLGERLPKSEGVPGYLYRADSNEFDGAGIKWKPSIHMPRAASRLLLEITAVRCERLQDISEADAVAEGILPATEQWRIENDCTSPDWYFDYLSSPKKDPDYRFYYGGVKAASCSYRSLWQKINGPDSWAANPWVWVVEFKVIEGGKEGTRAV